PRAVPGAVVRRDLLACLDAPVAVLVDQVEQTRDVAAAERVVGRPDQLDVVVRTHHRAPLPRWWIPVVRTGRGAGSVHRRGQHAGGARGRKTRAPLVGVGTWARGPACEPLVAVPVVPTQLSASVSVGALTTVSLSPACGV